MDVIYRACRLTTNDTLQARLFYWIIELIKFSLCQLCSGPCVAQPIACTTETMRGSIDFSSLIKIPPR